MHPRLATGLLIAGAAIAALAFSGAANASIDPSTGKEDVNIPPPQEDDGSTDDNTLTTLTGDPMTDFASLDPDTRLAAFLYMIRCCENKQSSVADGSCYLTFFGGSRFVNTADHPVLTGEKVGYPLDFLGGSYVGKVSTAAGAYQINVPTWHDVQPANPRWGDALPDFGVASQDAACTRVLMLCGAYDAIQAGNLDAALRKASSRWASLPYSSAGQGGRTMDFALARLSEGYTA